MGPNHLKFGGGVAETVLNPVVLIIAMLAGLLILFLPRRKAVIPFLAAGILIPMDQVLLIGPAHFPMLRVLVFFGIFRILKDKFNLHRVVFSGGINKIDIAVMLLTVFIAINAVLLFQDPGAVIYQSGNLYSVFGTYFLLRFLIRDEADMVRAVRTLAYIAAIVAVTMTYEFTTGHNPYAWLGGARAAQYADLVQRGDRFRAQAGFSHSILAGTFGAVLLPLFVALWWKGQAHRKIAALGIASATIITLACNSSTPVIAYAAGIFALCLWPLRRHMRVIRWSVVIVLVGLHLVMKAPVWHLIARIDITGGSSSWHRFMLVDQCIRHFGDWWLVGVKDTSAWGWDMWDTANEYVGLCDNSGLLPFLLFLAVLGFGFSYLGKARRRTEKIEKDHRGALFLWALGAALFANTVAFFGISYFDQNMVAWYGLLAMISTAYAVHRKKKLKTVHAPASAEFEEEELIAPLVSPEVMEAARQRAVGSGLVGSVAARSRPADPWSSVVRARHEAGYEAGYEV